MAQQLHREHPQLKDDSKVGAAFELLLNFVEVFNAELSQLIYNNQIILRGLIEVAKEKDEQKLNDYIFTNKQNVTITNPLSYVRNNLIIVTS